ncbi:Hypothetical protein PBC10988_2560 [Planctomycetales bacterium 10988]|nr:Hypothetical protein PBC10988_2560 [Planctomycetales bacterium 10988]
MNDTIITPDWLAELTAMVCDHLTELDDRQREHQPDLRQELQSLKAQTEGWKASLANPDLALPLRRKLEEEYGVAIERMEEIERLLAEASHQADSAERLLDPQQVLDRLDSLNELLAGENVTMANMELSLHLDKIVCSPEGKVAVRTCMLGGMTETVELLKGDHQNAATNKGGRREAYYGKPRRRVRARLGEADDGREDLRSLADFACDPERFADLPDEWFWEDVFEIPEKTSPYQEMAIEVATDRLAGLTHERLAKKYGTTTPTIRKALKYAAKIDERFRQMPRKMAPARWHEDHASEVGTLKESEGLTMKQLVNHFEKSDNTIRKALKHYRQMKEEEQSS